MAHWLDKPFDQELFEKYQTQLLYFVNNPIGKFYLGIKDPREVVKLTNNSFHVYKGKRQIEATFYGRPVYAEKLKWLAQNLKFSLNLPFVLNGVPIVFATTTTFNPNASAIDGIVARVVVAPGEVFSTLRNGAGTETPVYSGITPALYCGTSGGGFTAFNYIQRCIVLFDTSALGSGADISATTFELYVTSKQDDWVNGSISIVTSTPASNTTLETADYSQTGTVKQATDLTIASITTSAYNAWTFNATGISNISLTNISKFGVRYTFELEDSSPGWISGNLARFIAHSQQGANKPKLNITYTSAAGASFLTAFM